MITDANHYRIVIMPSQKFVNIVLNALRRLDEMHLNNWSSTNETIFTMWDILAVSWYSYDKTTIVMLRRKKNYQVLEFVISSQIEMGNKVPTIIIEWERLAQFGYGPIVRHIQNLRRWAWKHKLFFSLFFCRWSN